MSATAMCCGIRLRDKSRRDGTPSTCACRGCGQSRCARALGYLVEEAWSTPAPAPVPDVPRTLEQLTLSYERGAFPQLLAGLQQQKDPAALLGEFEGRGNPWPAAPKREAAFALELADTAVF